MKKMWIDTTNETSMTSVVRQFSWVFFLLCSAVLPFQQARASFSLKTGLFSLLRAGFLCAVPSLFSKELHCHKNCAAFAVRFVPTFSQEACLAVLGN